MKISYYLAKRLAFTAFVSVTLIALGAALSAVSALDKYIAVTKQLEGLKCGHVSASATESSSGYWVKEYESFIGVFNSEGELEYTVEVFIKTLPKRDRELLKSGIFAENREKLLEILGDYTS